MSKVTRTKEQLGQTAIQPQNQSQLMEAMFNSVSDGVVVTDTEGDFLFVNPIAERIVGMGATEGPADQWSETYGTFYPDGKKPFPSEELPLARAMRGEPVDDVELLIRNQERPAGVSINVNARPLRDDAGELRGGIIVLRDITEMKKTESDLRQTVQHLQEQAELMETIFNCISDGVVVADENGAFTIFNPSAERIVGIGSTDTGPDQWSEQYGIFFPDRVTPVPAEDVPLVRALKGQSTDEMDVFIRNPEVPEGVYLSVNEPTAAALAYGTHRSGETSRVLVFDLGGGTFDVTVMEIAGREMNILATNGDHRLGGKDWDDRIIVHLAERFEGEHGENPLQELSAYQELQGRAVQAKIQLSSLTRTVTVIHHGGRSYRL